MNRKEIFNLGKNKKFDFSGSLNNFSSKSRKNRDCDDEFRLSIASVTPVLDNIKFSHNGCLLSRAAMNALIEVIQGKTAEEAIGILEEFKKFIQGFKIREILPEKLLLFKKFAKFPARHECIFLPCDIILDFLKNHY